ncbi:ATP-binding cassette domain-containing protein [Hominifimenecus sp. rT4P-3]|uniref:ATP-binding cassette domain-containing protein n=1 Tax=Hominifimenecus sp. rT4P-3 TaxID=3242979 RepID=UPI003DA51DD9
MEILRAEKITQWFPPNRRILEAVDLSVEEGEMVSILAEPGSGKTLLLEILSGFRAPSEGTVYLLEKKRTGETAGAAEAFRRKYLGILPRDPGFLPLLTLEENVALPLLLGGMSGKKARRLAKEWLNALGIGAMRERLSGQLSAYEKCLGNVVRGTLSEPKLVFADDFTADLTEAEEERLFEAFLEILRRGSMTLIQTTSSPRTAARGSRVLMLKDGKIYQDCEIGGESE